MSIEENKNPGFPNSETKSMISNAYHTLPASFGLYGIYIAVFQNEVFICHGIDGLYKIKDKIPISATIHMFPVLTNKINSSLRLELKTSLREMPEFLHAPTKILLMNEYEKNRKFVPIRICLNRQENLVNMEIHKSEDSIKLLPEDVAKRSMMWVFPLNDFVHVKF